MITSMLLTAFVSLLVSAALLRLNAERLDDPFADRTTKRALKVASGAWLLHGLLSWIPLVGWVLAPLGWTWLVSDRYGMSYKRGIALGALHSVVCWLVLMWANS